MGLLPAPEYEENQQMQQHSSQYWADHFRKLIAEQPDIQQFLNQEQQNGVSDDAS